METFDGWCCFWQRCKGIGVACVRVEGCEVCLACARRVFAVEVTRDAERFAATVAVEKEPQPC